MKKYLILILTTICACLVIPCLWQKTVSVHAASVSSQQSLTNAVNSLADKNDLQTRESTLIQAAQTDITDTIADRKKSVGDDEQKDIKSFQDLDGELTKIAEQAEKKAKSYKTTLSSADYQKLIKYEKALDKYINAVQDYATTLESEGAVQSNPDASSSDKRIAKKDTSQAKQRLDNAKKKWLASYANSTMS